jgi:hypothetical protein
MGALIRAMFFESRAARDEPYSSSESGPLLEDAEGQRQYAPQWRKPAEKAY